MIKRNIEELLFNTDITMYQVHKETGIAQTTLSDYSRGISKIGNMKLYHAIKLNEFYLKNFSKTLD